VMGKAGVGAELQGFFPHGATGDVDTLPSMQAEKGSESGGGSTGGVDAIGVARKEAEAAATVQPQDKEMLQRMLERHAAEQQERREAASQLKRRGSKRKVAAGQGNRTAV
jgi:hypothetical protein